MSLNYRGKKLSRPLLSIITPSFNHGKYIEATINSVLNQSYNNIEYIVIDGGSTDNTVEILKKYEGRLKWISERDQGPEDAINKGFKMASGDLLAWIASDDMYLPGVFSKVVDLFGINQNIDMIYGKSSYIDKDNVILFEYPTEPFEDNSLAVYNIICQPSTFFTRRAFYDAGQLALDLKIASDYDLWIRISKLYKIMYEPQLFSYYRLHEDAKTLGFKDHLAKIKECLDITYKYYNWAPANRVYPYCYYLCKKMLPQWLSKFDILIKLIAIMCSVFKYVQLNKGIRLADIRYVPRNLKKMFFGWELEKMICKQLNNTGRKD